MLGRKSKGGLSPPPGGKKKAWDSGMACREAVWTTPCRGWGGGQSLHLTCFKSSILRAEEVGGGGGGEGGGRRRKMGGSGRAGCLSSVADWTGRQKGGTLIGRFFFQAFFFWLKWWTEATWEQRQRLGSGGGSQYTVCVVGGWGVWNSMEKSWHHFQPIPGQEARLCRQINSPPPPRKRLPDTSELLTPRC